VGQSGVRTEVFRRLLDTWNDGDPQAVLDLVTDDYRGHMLYMAAGERTAAQYPDWIRAYRSANPGVVFAVVEQTSAEDRLWTRVSARRPDGSVAHGVNISRFVGPLIAEEWAVWSGWLP